MKNVSSLVPGLLSIGRSLVFTHTRTHVYTYYIYIYIFMLVSDFQIYTPTHTHIFMLYQKDKNDLPKESCPATSFSLVIH